MSFAIALIAGFGKVKFLIGLSDSALSIDHFVEHDFHAEPFKRKTRRANSLEYIFTSGEEHLNN